MNPVIARLMEIAAASKQLDEEISLEEQFPDLVATIMRYDSVLRRKENEIINEHISGIAKPDLITAKTAYTKSYFLSLPPSYDGIRRLCNELLYYCRIFKVTPSDVWISYSDGSFDWLNDIENMRLES